jgi:23S rRNA (adenine2030-N6)-methyltransferase
MKYRHSFHAGNFADVHKHVTLLALLGALKRKDTAFLYLDTHAGRGSYDLSSPSAESAEGIARFALARHGAPELRDFAARLAQFRGLPGQRYGYPGSPLLAARELRPQDRAVFIEWLGSEAQALEAAVAALVRERGAEAPHLLVQRGDGFERLRAFLPPQERRALTFIDPPYEQSAEDFSRLTAALAEGLRRFPRGVFAAWYPVKEQRRVSAWQASGLRTLAAPILVSELWMHARDSRVGLNGSGLLVANPPYRTLERMQEWLPELRACLASDPAAGAEARMLAQSA